jgi:hypothetical protein
VKHFMLTATLLLTLTLTYAPRAEARIFEPQRDWQHSGRTCIESRAPAGWDWDSPPRACVERETVAMGEQRRHADVLTFENAWAVALVEESQADKASAKVRFPRLEVFAQPIPSV